MAGGRYEVAQSSDIIVTIKENKEIGSEEKKIIKRFYAVSAGRWETTKTRLQNHTRQLIIILRRRIADIGFAGFALNSFPYIGARRCRSVYIFFGFDVLTLRFYF